MYTTEITDGGFRLLIDGKCIFEHTDESPAVFLGKGREEIKMYRGNFDIRDRIDEKTPLHFTGISGGQLRFQQKIPGDYCINIQENDGLLYLKGSGSGNGNRLWLRLKANENEHVMGGGEQFSALDLRGRNYPIWTREQGVGRNKLTEITRLADISDGGGGDYHTTFFPQPTFISSDMYFAHLENYCYCELDFREKNYHELYIWDSRFSLVLGAGTCYEELLFKLSGLLGRQPELPEWAMRGMWLGVQGGTERVTELEKRCKDAGVDISAVWIQDWEGKRTTSFGQRLQWDWRWNEKMYPGLTKIIEEDSCVWLAYINPYLVKDGQLFNEAAENGYFVKSADGEDYLFDFGEFNCGVVDLTMPEAFKWYKELIKKNIIALGFKGWMADFGEYLPADAVCYNGENGLTAHNKWPVLWAKCCREALEESGMLGKGLFFMRSGAAGSHNYSTLTWAGDQCVDWSEDDGLPSVITAALSLGMSGFGLHTSDIGGYTTLFNLQRDKELLLRWLEFACFTPVMRTHEGNRPECNIQLYSDDEILKAAARLSEIHTALMPYMKSCVRENSAKGLPVMRPLFMIDPVSPEGYNHRLYSYLLGGDMLVAPVVEQGSTERDVWLPKGTWVHLWSGKSFSGSISVPAKIGFPPVFYKANSKFADLFSDIARNF